MTPFKSMTKEGFFTLLFLTYIPLTAATRSDVNLLEASEGIRFISQQIVKDYFYLAQNHRNKAVMNDLHKGVLQLDTKLRTIASATNSEDTKDILTFLAYSRDEIEETIAEPYSADNAALMLDYSEALLEGAESIAAEHSYQFSTEEQMLINVKKMQYLIERMSKYYMTFQLGINDLNNIKQLHEAIEAFENGLEQLNAYGYTEQSASVLSSLNQFWPIAKKFYLDSDKIKLPNVLNLSTQHIENTLTDLELYHSQNL